MLRFAYHFYLLVVVQMLKSREETRINFLKRNIFFFPGLKKKRQHTETIIMNNIRNWTLNQNLEKYVFTKET